MSDRPLKVLRIITRLNIGGPAIHAALLSTKMDRRRFSTCLVVGQPDRTEGDLSDLVHGTSVRLLHVASLSRPVHPLADMRTLVRLSRIVWKERPDIIHTHMAKAGTLGRIAGLLFNRLGPGRRPDMRAFLVHTFHGHVLSGYFGRWTTTAFLWLERWLARHTDVQVAVSLSVRNDLLRLKVGTSAQMRVVPLGLDLSVLSAINGRREELRRSLGLPPAVPLVGIIGRLVPIKQHEIFLQAARRLAGNHPSMQFVVVGDGERRTQLRAMVRTLGLEDRVHFLGWRLDLPAIYADVDCVCLTSRNEGTPVSLIEAMAAGRPVIATAVGGVPDLLGDIVERQGTYAVAQRGILVPLANAEAGVAAAVSRLFEDETLRERVSAAGRAFVCERLTAQRLVDDMTTLYTELVGGRRR
jgi:glycosyltransferase involved in cell wall biosynthesis